MHIKIDSKTKYAIEVGNAINKIFHSYKLMMAQELNNFFENATNSLEIIENPYIVEDTSQIFDPVEKALHKFKYHPSIMLIKDKVRLDTSFNFNEATCFEIEEEINRLNPKKASTRNSIPTKILKQNSEVCKQHLTNIINLAIRDGNFPKELKLADATPIFKKDNPNDPKNYRPVSVLPNISKIFERTPQKQNKFTHK